jgi:hypothetical protein
MSGWLVPRLLASGAQAATAAAAATVLPLSF